MVSSFKQHMQALDAETFEIAHPELLKVATKAKGLVLEKEQQTHFNGVFKDLVVFLEALLQKGEKMKLAFDIIQLTQLRAPIVGWTEGDEQLLKRMQQVCEIQDGMGKLESTQPALVDKYEHLYQWVPLIRLQQMGKPMESSGWGQATLIRNLEAMTKSLDLAQTRCLGRRSSSNWWVN